VTNDHQTKNAQSLVDVKAAKMISNDSFNGVRLVSAIEEILWNKELSREMAEASKQHGVVDSAERLWNVVMEVSR
jgi:UDP-N-acetylglucosamine--N-acetylmuramyl-(pentapeptide) pyrophosphoryl-undecaprenol N-acetylglucosamine transferase